MDMKVPEQRSLTFYFFFVVDMCSQLTPSRPSAVVRSLQMDIT